MQQQPPQAGLDDDLVGDILAEEEKKMARERVFYRRPEFWFALSAALMLPGLFLPWVRFFGGGKLDAFHVPLIFFITGQKIGISFLSVGVLLALAFVVCAVFAFHPRRIGTYMRAAAGVAILLALAAGLFALRSWGLSNKNADHYHQYELRQQEIIGKAYGKTDSFFGREGQDTADETQYVLPPNKGMSFLLKLLGPGVLFALLGGIAVMVSTYVFASSQKFLNYQLPTTATAMVIVFGGFGLILLSLHLFFPARWYQLTATVYQTVGMPKREEKALKKCSELPVPPLSCEMNLARLYADTDRQAEALALYHNLAARYPKYIEISKQVGMIFFRQREYMRAVLEFRKFREQIKNDTEVNAKMSDALRRLGDDAFDAGSVDSALSLYKEAYDLVPKMRRDMAMNLRLAELLIRKNNYKDASDYYKRAANQDRKDFKLQSDAASVLEQAGEHDDAIKYYERCINAKNDELQCYKHIALIQWQKKGDPAAARQTIEEGLAIKRVGDDAHELNNLLQTIR